MTTTSHHSAPRRRRSAPSPARRRLTAAVGAVALAVTGSLTTLPVAAGTAAAAPTGVTITPNPSYQSAPFEGWGTSLVWFANATGGYPEDVREELRAAVFGEEGLNLNIARYNVGGGNAVDVPGYLRPGGAVEGWWNPEPAFTDDQGPVTATWADRERYRAAWDGDDPASYNLDADAPQRWWIDAIKEDVTRWEVFSNSPPYFLTQSGFVSGGVNDPRSEQLAEEDMEAFADYLVTVTEELESTHGITVDTIDPFNEPNTSYWSTSIRDGEQWPNSDSRQEGAHIGPEAQDQMIQVLAARLSEPGTTTQAVVSAMDETNPGTFVTNWRAYSPSTREQVSQYNVHTYGTGDRQVVRDIAKVDRTPLWMSEVEGDWSPKKGLDLTEMGNGLGMAQRITDDLRELEPEAWVFWQPVEDLYNMERVERLNWGSVLIDFDCDDQGRSARRVADGDADPTCRVVTNSKYNTVRNYTHYIVPGSRLIPTTSTQSTAALRPDGSGMNLVHVNDSADERTVTLDLSLFASVAGATVTPVTTTESPVEDPTANALVSGQAVAVDPVTSSVTLTVPARSVTTFLVDGVTGVSPQGHLLEDGRTYELTGVQSGRVLTADGGGVVIDDSSPERAEAQLWTVSTISGAGTNDQRVTLTNRQGLVLANVGGSAAAVDPGAVTGDAAVWIVTTTNGQDLSLVSATEPVAVEVNGQARAAGSRVGTYRSNGGGNQRWTARDVTVVGFVPVSANTAVGTAPVLPATVTPLYSDGAGTPVPVEWDLSGQDWMTTGTVTLTGSGTDAYGSPFTTATATVEVGPVASADPASVTVRQGATVEDLAAAAPPSVRAQAGASQTRFDVPVMWDLSGVTAEDLAAPGIVAAAGTASSGGAQVPAVLHVIVVGSAPANVAPESRASATFTEPGYGVEATTNLVLTDKAWSNWKGSGKNATDVLTYTLPGTEVVHDAVLYFYMDGSSHSWPTHVQPEYLAPGAQEWTSLEPVEVPDAGTAPTLRVSLGDVEATAVRFVLTARDNTHMIVSEVEVNALRAAPASVSTLARLVVGGSDVAGFDPAVTGYELSLPAGAAHDVVAVATDGDARVDQRSGTNGDTVTTTITVTAPDGSQTVYTVRVTLTAPDPVPSEPESAEPAPSASPAPSTPASPSPTEEPDDAAPAPGPVAPSAEPAPTVTQAPTTGEPTAPTAPGTPATVSAPATAGTAQAPATSGTPTPHRTGSLARTGVPAATTAVGLLVLLGAGGALLARRRLRS